MAHASSPCPLTTTAPPHTHILGLVLLKVCVLMRSLASPHLVLFHTCTSPTPQSRTKMCSKAACETIRNLNHRLFKCILIPRKLHFPSTHHNLGPKLIPTLLAFDCVIKEGPIPFPCLSFFSCEKKQKVPLGRPHMHQWKHEKLQGYFLLL